MKPYVVLTKKNVVLAACILVLILAGAVFFVFAETDSLPSGSTQKERVRYLAKLGITVEKGSESKKNTAIPETFSDVYEQYNALQNQAGFDLSAYRGAQVTVYTYRLRDAEQYANLIVYNGRVIGGDIAEAAFGGSMRPLLPRSTQEEENEQDAAG